MKRLTLSLSESSDEDDQLGLAAASLYCAKRPLNCSPLSDVSLFSESMPRGSSSLPSALTPSDDRPTDRTSRPVSIRGSHDANDAERTANSAQEFPPWSIPSEELPDPPSVPAAHCVRRLNIGTLSPSCTSRQLSQLKSIRSAVADILDGSGPIRRSPKTLPREEFVAKKGDTDVRAPAALQSTHPFHVARAFCASPPQNAGLASSHVDVQCDVMSSVGAPDVVELPQDAPDARGIALVSNFNRAPVASSHTSPGVLPGCPIKEVVVTQSVPSVEDEPRLTLTSIRLEGGAGEGPVLSRDEEDARILPVTSEKKKSLAKWLLEYAPRGGNNVLCGHRSNKLSFVKTTSIGYVMRSRREQHAEAAAEREVWRTPLYRAPRPDSVVRCTAATSSLFPSLLGQRGDALCQPPIEGINLAASSNPNTSAMPRMPTVSISHQRHASSIGNEPRDFVSNSFSHWRCAASTVFEHHPRSPHSATCSKQPLLSTSDSFLNDTSCTTDGVDLLRYSRKSACTPTGEPVTPSNMPQEVGGSGGNLKYPLRRAPIPNAEGVIGASVTSGRIVAGGHEKQRGSFQLRVQANDSLLDRVC